MSTISDPAWFYSSLAQVCAAIVGLVGAILGSRLVDHLNAMRSERADIDAVLGGLRITIAQRSERAAKVLTFLRQRVQDVEAALGRKVDTIEITEVYEWSRYGTLSAPEHVDVSSLQQLRRTLQAHEVWGARAFGLATGGVRARDLGLRAANLQRYMDQLLEKEHPHLKDYKNDLDSCGRQLGGFEVKVFPASLVPVFVTLAVMALAGIVWPLSILPGLEVTSKTWMLLSLTLGLIALFVYFAQVFLALWGLGRVSWPEPETEG